ncbi:hypothetical protein DS742_25390 [Lacrimispora amygdalina]|uniref:Uncharacterized protein n=1 Tax=Lacrimispora amygdalina TaxID=253257 RepID=A0A3E2N5E5_9FIRM|nr:hypothetical protein [Clostridium indicum]RFZ76111.1 hypothetical protein DS742_25390 [Clostridium indicum]
MRHYDFPTYFYKEGEPPYLVAMNLQKDITTCIENNTKNICAWIMIQGLLASLEIWTANGEFVLSALSTFLDKVPDQAWVVQGLQPLLVPMQMGEVEVPEVVYFNPSDLEGYELCFPDDCKFAN